MGERPEPGSSLDRSFEAMFLRTFFDPISAAINVGVGAIVIAAIVFNAIPTNRDVLAWLWLVCPMEAFFVAHALYVWRRKAPK